MNNEEKKRALAVLVNDEEFYHILSAIRGPDIDHLDTEVCRIKWFFTARIRAMVGQKSELGPWVKENKDDTFMIAGMTGSEIRKRVGVHYLHHIINALSAIYYCYEEHRCEAALLLAIANEIAYRNDGGYGSALEAYRELESG
jgi:hypothetical protein